MVKGKGWDHKGLKTDCVCRARQNRSSVCSAVLVSVHTPAHPDSETGTTHCPTTLASHPGASLETHCSIPPAYKVFFQKKPGLSLSADKYTEPSEKVIQSLLKEKTLGCPERIQEIHIYLPHPIDIIQ